MENYLAWGTLFCAFVSGIGSALVLERGFHEWRIGATLKWSVIVSAILALWGAISFAVYCYDGVGRILCASVCNVMGVLVVGMVGYVIASPLYLHKQIHDDILVKEWSGAKKTWVAYVLGWLVAMVVAGFLLLLSHSEPSLIFLCVLLATFVFYLTQIVVCCLWSILQWIYCALRKVADYALRRCKN